MRVIDFFPDPFINALAWTLIHTLWQIALIAFLWRALLFLVRYTPARVKHDLTLFFMVLIPLVAIITFVRQYSVFQKAEQISSIEFGEGTLAKVSIDSTYYIIPSPENSLSSFLDNNSGLIFWIYVFGILAMSAFFLISYIKVSQLKKNSVKPVPEAWMSAVEQLMNQTLNGRKIPVLLSPRVSVPMVVGFFKPVVLFPLAIASSLTMDEVEDILRHELYHIRCNDQYVNAFQYFVEILFFFHPFAWWMSNTLRSLRESKVDEWVVTQTHKPLNYAQTLISLEEKRNQIFNQPVLAATSSKKLLLNRIKHIMHMKTRKFNPGQKFAAFLVIAAAAFSLAWLEPPSFMVFADEPTSSLTVDHSSSTSDNSPNQPAVNFTTSLTTTVVVDDSTKTEPTRIIMKNGESIEWAELSAEEKEEIMQAVVEARAAMQEAMAEIKLEFDAEEIRIEMEQVRVEIAEAMAEMNRELNNEEVKQELREAQIELEMAMEELNEYYHSEEFQQEMQEMKQEVREAMEEVRRELDSEEFKVQTEQLRIELQKALQELDSIDTSVLESTITITLEAVAKSMEAIAPTINEILEEVLEEVAKETERVNENRPDRNENQPDSIYEY